MGNDIVFECAFYGRNAGRMGCLYYRPADVPAEDMELLFASIYLCSLLSDRRISFQTAVEIQELCRNTEAVEQALEEGCAQIETLQIPIVDYHSGWDCGLSASMMCRERPVFRFGHIGYGLMFKNKKKIAFCCKASVYGICDTLLKVRKQDPLLKRRLMTLVEYVGKLKLGDELYKGNYVACAHALYHKVLETEVAGERAGYGSQSG